MGMAQPRHVLQFAPQQPGIDRPEPDCCANARHQQHQPDGQRDEIDQQCPAQPAQTVCQFFGERQGPRLGSGSRIMLAFHRLHHFIGKELQHGQSNKAEQQPAAEDGQSGRPGEQQRVQFARVLAQVWEPMDAEGSRWLFLDEPVSSLDIRHQIQIMSVGRDYAIRGGGVIAIMHDLNLTAMFADRVVMMHEGRVAAAGAPGEVLKDDLLARVFGCDLKVGTAPPSGTTFVLPHSVIS